MFGSIWISLEVEFESELVKLFLSVRLVHSSHMIPELSLSFVISETLI